MFRGKTIGWAITGSFCTIPEIYNDIERVMAEGANIIPIISEKVARTDTRVGPAHVIAANLEKVTGNNVIRDMNHAEPIGPKKMFDLLVIAPCTGSSIARLNCGITDSCVLMAAKAHLRNNRPVVIGISTNDGTY
ncbi:MAG: dipicolinate synthase subunit B [Oscillospiraceae bacterium]|nr:dipicolinate synthase subunit B [Oscillospiraceae bacterium]